MNQPLLSVRVVSNAILWDIILDREQTHNGEVALASMIDARLEEGYLHDVAEMGDCPPAGIMLKALLAAGADTNLREKNGRTPSDLAESMGHPMPSFQTTLSQSPSCSRAADDFARIRARALIATLTYSFARINAALKMKVDDLRPRGAGWTVRLHEKGGKQHSMPCHHALAEALRAYIDAAGIAEDRKGWLFRTARGHNGSALSGKPMSQPDAWRMIRRRAAAAGIAEAIGCHTFRATGITAYLANGGALEHAQEMAAHESPRTTKLYDRTKERLTQDEVERIRL